MYQYNKMWDDELKEFTKLLAERMGIKPTRPTELMEEVCHEEVQEGQTQEAKGKGKEGKEEGSSEREQTPGEGATSA